MQLDFKMFRFPVWGLIIAASVMVMLIFGYWYWAMDDKSTKMVGLVGGVVSGLAVFLITYITVIGPSLRLEHFTRMGIVDVLNNRHDKDYYEKLVATARYSVRVMGASCTRFVNDFLDPDADDKKLFDQLQRHGQLKVELLVPVERHLAPRAKANTPELKKKLEALDAIFPGRVILKRFDGKAHHSFVIVDDDLVAGPVFEGDKSRHAPAVHVKMTSTYAMKYRDFFEQEWAKIVP